MTKKKNIIILTLILLLGLFARLYQLDKEGLIIVEIYVFENCSMGVPSLIQHWFSEGHFPTYFIIMHYWMKMFGNTEFAMRFLSLISGVLSIYAMYLVGKRFFNEKTGLLAAFLMSASILNIYYSQIAQPYSMLVLFILMSFLFLYEALEKNTRLYWAGYVGFTLLGLLLSASALPIIICQMVVIKLSWPAYKERIGAKKIEAVFFSILFIYLPFLSKLIISSFKDNRLVPLRGIEHPSFMAVADMFNFFGGKIYMLGHMAQRFHFLADAFGAALFLLCLKGIFSLFKSGEKEDRVKAVFLSIWLGGPIILLFVFSMLISPALGPARYLLYISAAYYLLASKGIMSFRKKRLFTAVVVIAVFSFITMAEYCYALRYIDKRILWREAHYYIDSHIKTGERVVFSFYRTPALDVLLRYLNRSSVGVWSDNLPLGVIGDKAVKITRVPYQMKSTEAIELEKVDYEGIWFAGYESKLNTEIAKLFKDKYDLTEEEKIGDIILYHFRRKL